MTPGHLVANANLALARHVHLGHLHDARGQFVAHLHLVLLALKGAVNLAAARLIVAQQRGHLLVERFVARKVEARGQALRVDLGERVAFKRSAFA